MTTKQIVDNFSNTVINSVQTAFTAPTGKNVVIEAFTAANNSGVNAAYSCYIQSTVGALQPQRKDKIVVWGRNDPAIGVVGQVIPAGGSLKVETTALNSIYFTVTGREVDT